MPHVKEHDECQHAESVEQISALIFSHNEPYDDEAKEEDKALSKGAFHIRLEGT